MPTRVCEMGRHAIGRAMTGRCGPGVAKPATRHISAPPARRHQECPFVVRIISIPNHNCIASDLKCHVIGSRIDIDRKLRNEPVCLEMPQKSLPATEVVRHPDKHGMVSASATYIRVITQSSNKISSRNQVSRANYCVTSYGSSLQPSLHCLRFQGSTSLRAAS